METGPFSHAVVVQMGALSSSVAHFLSFLLSFCSSLKRVFEEDEAKMMEAGEASALCLISSTIGFFNRLDPFVQVDQVAGIQADAKERVAQVPVDDVE